MPFYYKKPCYDLCTFKKRWVDDSSFKTPRSASPPIMFLIFPDPASIAAYVSQLLVDRIKAQPEIVLGLATGGTMEPVYAHFVEQARQQQLNVSRLTSFNLDEYVGLGPEHPQSYAAYMQQHLFAHLPFNPEQLHLPDGLTPDLNAHCQRYAQQIQQQGGVALQLLGVGSNGHIGFNEPGTAFDSRCHVVELSAATRHDNSRFFDNPEEVPALAITMGMQDIMDASEILLVATGLGKAEVVAEYYHQAVSEALPMSVLKQHPRACVILDEAAARLLPEDVRQQKLVVNA